MVYRALRRKAAQHKRTAATVDPKKRADFSDLAGRWTPDPAFDEIAAGQRRIDLDKWKSPALNATK